MDYKTLNYYALNAAIVAQRYESVVNGMAEYFGIAFSSGSRVLDLGCGSGRDLALLHSMGCDVYGLDATTRLVELAQEIHPELIGKVVYGTIPQSTIPFGGDFDGVLCSAVLMHIDLDNLPTAVGFIKACLKPGAQLLYSIPSKREDVTAESHRDSVGRLFIPDSTGRLQGLFEAAGFTLVACWDNADSLGRDEVAWETVLMRLPNR